MVLRFRGGPGFFRKHSWLLRPTLPPLQAVSAQPTAVLSLGLSSKPRVTAPSPHPYQWTRVSGWGTQGSGTTVRVGLSLSCLPLTGCCALLQASEAPFLSRLISPPVRLPWVWEPLLCFSSTPPGAQVSSHFLYFFFFPLSYPVTWRSFLSFEVFEVFC